MSNNLLVPLDLAECTTLKIMPNGEVLNYSDHLEESSKYKEVFLRFDNSKHQLFDVTSNNRVVAAFYNESSSIQVFTVSGNTTTGTTVMQVNADADFLHSSIMGALVVVPSTTSASLCCGGGGGKSTSYNAMLHNNCIATWDEDPKTKSCSVQVELFGTDADARLRALVLVIYRTIFDQ
jgi:hypothetical protein